MEKKYWVLAFYYFTDLADPQEEVERHKKFFSCRDMKGRIYISSQGISAQVSSSIEAGEEYVEWLKKHPSFPGIKIKIQTHTEHAFPRVTIKYRPQLVALDRKVDMQKVGERLSPKAWREALEKKEEDILVIDVRNRYEWEIGHFEGAVLPPLEQFRDFPSYAKQLKKEKNPKKSKLFIYCTAGIRCEFYSALLKEEGFDHVYQLDGGVVQYGIEEGNKYWKGKLFVFDDRLSVPISEDPVELISKCSFCDALTDFYYNCANMDCNALFLSCPNCALERKGCCKKECEESNHRREFLPSSTRPKPYRREHLLECGCTP